MMLMPSTESIILLSIIHFCEPHCCSQAFEFLKAKIFFFAEEFTYSYLYSINLLVFSFPADVFNTG